MRKYLRQRWILNLGLLVVIAVLLSLSLIGEEETTPIPLTLADSFAEPVKEIKILRAGKHDIHFQLKDDYWHMLEPYQARADGNLIDQILSITSLPAKKVAPLSDINPVDFGLDQAEASIVLNDKPVRFGNEQPVNQQRYIGLDDQLLLIADQYMMRLKAGSISYIDRHLLPQGSLPVSLVVNDESIDLQQQQDKSRAWQTIKANWISLAADDYLPRGIDIRIKLKGETQEMHYVGEKRDADIVFTNMQSRLEYHMPLTAHASLGITMQPTTAESGEAIPAGDNN